ncbi:MAG: hypothetical protein AMQ22_01956 [Candidatus Methanofastidiosum methylothiophilum]|uniref:Uncharacterized protein n=1 Tax=Candidatus Methanofastidiosum methylothiophilum TaxID=1705564 RepID=A0A150IRC5_9EURY|nr:MAG: hypothetical protein AMQ22_01956 [Candidatus Methanofastidiosum methylthiophilus]
MPASSSKIFKSIVKIRLRDKMSLIDKKGPHVCVNCDNLVQKDEEKEIGICSIAASTKTTFKKFCQKCDERSALTGELWIYIDGEDWG